MYKYRFKLRWVNCGEVVQDVLEWLERIAERGGRFENIPVVLHEALAGSQLVANRRYVEIQTLLILPRCPRFSNFDPAWHVAHSQCRCR